MHSTDARGAQARHGNKLVTVVEHTIVGMSSMFGNDKVTALVGGRMDVIPAIGEVTVSVQAAHRGCWVWRDEL